MEAARTLQGSQARKSALQSMLAQFRCGSCAGPPHSEQGAAAGSFPAASPCASFPAGRATVLMPSPTRYHQQHPAWFRSLPLLSPGLSAGAAQAAGLTKHRRMWAGVV